MRPTTRHERHHGNMDAFIPQSAANRMREHCVGACSQYSIRSNRPKLKVTRRTMLLHAFAMVGGHEHHQLVSLNGRLQWCDPTARPGGIGSLELLRVAKELLVQPADRPLVLELDLIFCTIVVSKIIDAVDQRSNERVTYSK